MPGCGKCHPKFVANMETVKGVQEEGSLSAARLPPSALHMATHCAPGPAPSPRSCSRRDTPSWADAVLIHSGGRDTVDRITQGHLQCQPMPGVESRGDSHVGVPCQSYQSGTSRLCPLGSGEKDRHSPPPYHRPCCSLPTSRVTFPLARAAAPPPWSLHRPGRRSQLCLDGAGWRWGTLLLWCLAK